MSTAVLYPFFVFLVKINVSAFHLTLCFGLYELGYILVPLENLEKKNWVCTVTVVKIILVYANKFTFELYLLSKW